MKKNWIFSKSKVFLAVMISFICGIFLADLISFDKIIYQIIILVCILLLIIGVFWRKHFSILLMSICIIAFFLAFYYYGYFKERNFFSDLPYGKNVEFTGVISEEPGPSSDKTKLTVLVGNSNSTNLIRSKVLVSVPNYPIYKYGDVVKVVGLLEKPENFNEFDYEKYLLRYLVFSIIKQPTSVECINSNGSSKIKLLLIKLKNIFSQAIDRSLPEPTASLAKGILVGSGTNFSDGLKNDMKATGTTHIVVVSGQNMEIVSKVFVELTKYWSRFSTFFVGSIGLLLFAILTGASASVIRSAILASLFLFAKLVGRKKKIIIPLFFTALIMILINPLILKYDIGFQLSFLAMLGLIFLMPIFQKIFYKIKLPAFIKESLFATLSAQLMTLPILLYNFGQFSIIAPLTNVLILTVIPYAMGLSFLVGIGGMIFLKLGQLLALIAWPLLEYVIKIIEYFAKIPHVVVKFNWHNGYFIMCYFVILGLIIVYLSRKYEIKY